MNKIFKVGLIGCGHIAETYFRAHKYFNNFKIIKCADIKDNASKKCANIYGIKALSVKKLLEDEGMFVFESPYWLDSITSGKFDQIYHEHVTYISVKPIKKLASFFDLQINDVFMSDYHGGSLRIIVSKKKNIENFEKIENIIKKEEKLELYSEIFYNSFMLKLNKKRNIFMEKIYKSLINASPLVCIGAAAKGNTFLNFYGLDNKLVDYVTDNSEHKIGKYTPLTRIPITTDEIVKKLNKPNIIFTHNNRDLNIDHGIIHKAVMTASRPQSRNTIKQIYSFEIK